MSTSQLTIVITLEAKFTVDYAEYGIPEGDEGALMAAVARETRADQTALCYTIAEFSEVRILTVTKAEEQEAEQG